MAAHEGAQGMHGTPGEQGTHGMRGMNGPAPRVPSFLLAPLAWGYGRAVAIRNRAFDTGRRSIAQLDLPVISIGNLVAGGSGKTPMTAWIAGRLLQAGRRPLIALRGYGARDPAHSDEAMEYMALLPQVSLAVGADRVAAIALARSVLPPGREAPEVVLLDDGFQHRQVERSLDVVLVDATRPCLGGADAALLPQGWLREPPAALRRADAVVLTHAERVPPSLLALVTRLHGRPPVARFRHVWRRLDRYEHRDAPGDGPTRTAEAVPARAQPKPVAVESLRGLRVVTLLGVAKPDRVRAMVRSAGAELVGDIPVGDHQHYDDRLLARVARNARAGEALLTTPKDWTKLAPHLGAIGRPVLVPRLEVEPIEGGAALEALLMAAISGERGAAARSAP